MYYILCSQWRQRYHLLLSCDVIIWDDNTPCFIFPANFTHSEYTVYKLLTETIMWKLGLWWPRSSFSGNICFEFSVLCLCSVFLTQSTVISPLSFLFSTQNKTPSLLPLRDPKDILSPSTSWPTGCLLSSLFLAYPTLFHVSPPYTPSALSPSFELTYALFLLASHRPAHSPAPYWLSLFHLYLWETSTRVRQMTKGLKQLSNVWSNFFTHMI